MFTKFLPKLCKHDIISLPAPMLYDKLRYAEQLKLKYMYNKTCLKQQLKKKTKIGFQYQLLLNAGQSIAECSKRAFCNTFGLH